MQRATLECLAGRFDSRQVQCRRVLSECRYIVFIKSLSKEQGERVGKVRVVGQVENKSRAGGDAKASTTLATVSAAVA